MQDTLTFEMAFAELAAPSGADAVAALKAALTKAGETESEWTLGVPLLDPDDPARFGIEARPRTDRALDVSAAWDLSHRLEAALDAGHVEPVFAGEAEYEPPTELVLEGSAAAEPPIAADWHVTMVNARAAWELFGGERPGRGVLIGHPDTGYTRHPELGGETAWSAALERGINLVEAGAVPIDPLEGGVLRFPGHGTATGSVIVSAEEAETDGAPAVVGIAPGAELMPIRVARTVVTLGWTSRLAHAIERATDAGCQVISMSLGGPPSSRLARAVRHAHAKGVIVVAAAGNIVQFPVWPANYDEVVACAACGPDRRAWSGTSKGPTVDITAPGHRVRVAGWADGSPCTRAGSGTSFATAIVAGTAALWLSRHGPALQRYRGSLLPRAFLRLVRETAGAPAESVWHPSWLGAGVIDTGKLVMAELPTVEVLESVERSKDPLEALLTEPLTGIAPASMLRERVDESLRAELVFQLATDPALRDRLRGELAGAERGMSASVATTALSPQLRRALWA